LLRERLEGYQKNQNKIIDAESFLKNFQKNWMAKNKYVIYPKAAKDIEKIVAWYEQQYYGLGHVFIIHFKAAVYKILPCPEMYKSVQPIIRRFLMKQFAYSIFYIVEADAIIILRVRHSK
jgi:plasmid stabilization system protein ParE